MKPVSSGKSPFPGAVYELALALQWIGLCISPATWTMTQDENGVAVHFQWQQKTARGSSAQDGQPGQMAATHQPRPTKKQKPPSRQKRDRERWLRHQAHRKQASRQAKRESPREPPLAEAPVVQVASLKPPAACSQPLRLNVDAPVFTPNTVVKSTSHPFTSNDKPSQQSNSKSKSNEHISDNSVDIMSYSNKSDSDIINRNNDSDLPFSGLKDINTSDILDPTAVIKEDLIHTKSKLQRTNNRLQSTSKELRRINDMKNSTAKLYNELLMEHELLKFNEDKARDYGRVIQNRWWEELWLRIDAERESQEVNKKLAQLERDHNQATLHHKNQETTISSLQAELKKKELHQKNQDSTITSLQGEIKQMENTVKQHKANSLKEKQQIKNLQQENRQLSNNLQRSKSQYHQQATGKKTFNSR